jgi:hypothetical protein
MKYSWAKKCWSVLLSVCLVGFPLYAQAQDTVNQKDAQASQPQPVQQSNTPAAQKGAKADNFEDYMQGKLDGKTDAKGSAAWILAGLAGTGFCLLIGCAGIGLALVAPPSPPETALMGKSSSFIVGYVEGYKSSGRMKNAKWAIAGCTMAAVINLTINLASGRSFTNY